MPAPARPALAASILFGAVRVGLGLLWLHEGFVKVRAHFGSADILLVVDGAASNTRVPEYFRFVAEHLLRPMAHIAGIATPLTELGLGVVLVLGLFSVQAGAASAGLLAVYWSSDQLIAQYPIMAVLSVAVIATSVYSDRYSVLAVIRRTHARASATATALDRHIDGP